MSFFSFFLFEGLAVLWTLAAPLLEAGPRFAVLPTFFQSFSYGSLFVFASGPAASRHRKRMVLALSIGLIAICAVFGLVRGEAAYSLLVHALLGVPGMVFALLFIRAGQALRSSVRPWLTAFALTFGISQLFLVAESAAGMITPGFFQQWFLPAQVVFFLLLTITLTVHEWRSFNRANRGLGGRLMRASIYSAFFAIPVLIVLGWILTSVLGATAMSHVRDECANNVELLRATLLLETDAIDDSVSILARTQSIEDFSSSPDASRRPSTDAVLDMYAEATPGSIFYLLDADGRTLASSNHKSPLSFVGHVLPEIPETVSLLSENTQGEGQWRFFASTGRTGTRGYYAASAVHDARGRRRGTAVGKLNVESSLLRFGSPGDVLLVNALGVVLLSNSQGYSFRTLWPLTSALRRVLAASHQFSGVDLHPLITAEPADGSIVSWNGASALVTRAFLQVPGWSIVSFGSLREAVLFRMAGMLLTLFAIFIIAWYAVSAQLTLLNEVRIERSETLYRTLLEGTPNWISIVDEGGSFIFTNKAGQDSLGLGNTSWTPAQAENLLGAKASSEIAARVRESAGTGIVTVEIEIPVESGGRRAWRLTFVPLEREGPAAAAILIGNDVTDIRQAEAKLVRAERMGAVGTLAAGVAHQFNNINAAALGYLQVLEMVQFLPAAAAKYAGLVRTALERSVDITSRLLPLSFPYGMQESSANLADVVNGVIRDVQPDLDREDVRLEFTQSEPAVVSVNPEQMRFVVQGLLVNAWHAVLGKTKRSVHLSTGTSGATVFFSVQDTGCGIAPEKMSCLFTPFNTGKGEHAPSDSPQSGVRGVGLSLAVSHAIIAGHGGWIDVQSAVGEGSTFTVWLPAATADA